MLMVADFRPVLPYPITLHHNLEYLSTFSFTTIQLMLTTQYVKISNKNKKQQRVDVVDPETHISLLFARCRPTQLRCGAAHAGTVAAAAASALVNILIKH